MKLFKNLGTVSLLILLLPITTMQSFAQQKVGGELIFVADSLKTGESIYITIDAKNGYTRWFSSPPSPGNPPYLPTLGYGHYSEYESGSGTIVIYGSPDDNNNQKAIAWGWYSITIKVPSKSYNESFDLDLRDANWIHGASYRDTEIHYGYNSTTHKSFLTYNSEQGNISGNIGGSNTIWGWWKLKQNKKNLLVPVTATNNFSGGKIKMDGATYSTPKTLNWGWTTTHTIEAVTPQHDIDGRVYIPLLNGATEIPTQLAMLHLMITTQVILFRLISQVNLKHLRTFLVLLTTISLNSHGHRIQVLP